MSSRTRSKMIVVLVLACFAVPFDLALTFAAAPQGTSAAQKWAASLSEAQINQNVSHVATLSLDRRRALLAVMTPANRASVWAGTFDAFIERHRDITPAQRDLLVKAAAFATERFFTSPAPGERQQLAAIADQISSSLGIEARNELFRNAGPSTEGKTLGAMQRFVPRWLDTFVRSKVVVQAINCNCHREGGGGSVDCDPYDQFYCSSSVQCDYWLYGCGIWWLDDCNGYCWPVPSQQ